MGDSLRTLGNTPEGEAVITRSVEHNPWFTRTDILRAIDAICSEMLDRTKLREWLAHYPTTSTARRVAVIMAGNIPMVGLFDLVCVIAAGHECHIKPSSKDSVLMRYVVESLKAIDPNVAIYDYDPTEHYDMAIATGGDDANRYFREHFAQTRSLLRGSRHSIAVLDGTESTLELEGLTTDITAYSGLGCRSVAMLFIPRGTMPLLPHTEPINPKLRGTLRSTRALYTLQHRGFNDHGAYLSVYGEEFSKSLAMVTLREYDNLDEVRQWISTNAGHLQCIVSHADISGAVPFGRGQYPTLWDYADGIDTMRFLLDN